MKRLLYILILLAITSCSKTYDVPTDFITSKEEAPIYPDYKDIVIPENIAPLNFMIDSVEGLVVTLEGKKAGSITVSGEDRIDIDTTEWRNLLKQNYGSTIKVTVYANTKSLAKSNGKDGEKSWVCYAPHTLTVAEPIDAYLSYRLIEPGYELYRQLGLYQRCLENFDEEPIYENNRQYEDENNHCINCHNYRSNSTKDMLFHVRAKHGGTIIIRDGKAEKIDLKNDSILSAGVYPSWHPTLPLVAFSTNQTGQVFHMYHPEKIEVLDEKSDIILYDVEKNEVTNVLNDTLLMETFPNWSPDGKRLYYCVANEPIDTTYADSMGSAKIMGHYQEMLYNIQYLDFNQKTRTFSEPHLLVDWASKHKSATFPKTSPDGRFLLYAVGDYGQFHIWHKSSDLWMTDLQRDTTYALTEANSDDVDSYHTWSSNSRWIVFSSRRMDGNYTRPHIAYIDKNGQAHKAFCLPQRDPEQNIMLLKSYNVPELTKDHVRISKEALKDCIYNTEGLKAKYTHPTSTPYKGKNFSTDGVTGASKQTKQK